MAQKTNLAAGQIDAGGGVKELYQHIGAVYLQHLAAAKFPVGQLNFPQLVIGDTVYVFHQHQRAGDLGDGAVFFNHSPQHLPLR